jgi:hypothetical protein
VSEHFPQEVSRFQASVDASVSGGSDRTCDGSSKIEMDAEIARRLRDLGYLE